jgi:hypothetical protein
VLDAPGTIAAEFMITHFADGIAMLLRQLGRYAGPSGLPMAIESPDVRLVDLLLDAGYPVVPVKPSAIKTWRDSEMLPSANTDASDAPVIAEYLRLRAHTSWQS